jgi:flagellar biosynthesis component FlhA
MVRRKATMSPDGATPTVPVTLALSSGILGSQVLDEQLTAAIEGAVAREVSLIMESLGVPGVPTVAVEILTGADEPNIVVRPFRFTVNGRRCRVSAEEVQRIIGYMSGQLPAPRSHLLGLADALPSQRPPTGADGFASASLVEFLGLSCAQALRRAPSAVLGQEQCQAYLKELEAAHPGAAKSLEFSELRRVLSRVLDLRISIADTEVVAEAIFSGLDEGELAEELIAALRKPAIELHAPPELIDELMSTDVDYRESVTLFRDEMKDQIGISLPELRMVPVADIKPRSVRVKVNDIAGLPWMVLPGEYCMADAEPASLELFSLQASPMLHPSGGTASLISRADASRAAEMGLLVFTPIEHALACLGATLRTHAPCLIDRGVVDQALETFNSLAPLAVATARSTPEPSNLVGLLRHLVAQGLSIANLPLVVNLLQEHRLECGAWPVCATSIAAALTDEPSSPSAESYVRAGMPRSTLRRWLVLARTSALPAFVLDPELEADLQARARDGGLTEDYRDQLLDSLQEEIDFIPPGRGIPIVITSSAAQRPLREVVRDEFPLVGVVARVELPPEAKVEELGRLRAPIAAPSDRG